MSPMAIRSSSLQLASQGVFKLEGIEKSNTARWIQARYGNQDQKLCFKGMEKYAIRSTMASLLSSGGLKQDFNCTAAVTLSAFGGESCKVGELTRAFNMLGSCRTGRPFKMVKVKCAQTETQATGCDLKCIPQMILALLASAIAGHATTQAQKKEMLAIEGLALGLNIGMGTMKENIAKIHEPWVIAFIASLQFSPVLCHTLLLPQHIMVYTVATCVLGQFIGCSVVEYLRVKPMAPTPPPKPKVARKPKTAPKPKPTSKPKPSTPKPKPSTEPKPSAGEEEPVGDTTPKQASGTDPEWGKVMDVFGKTLVIFATHVLMYMTRYCPLPKN